MYSSRLGLNLKYDGAVPFNGLKGRVKAHLSVVLPTSSSSLGSSDTILITYYELNSYQVLHALQYLFPFTFAFVASEPLGSSIILFFPQPY